MQYMFFKTTLFKTFFLFAVILLTVHSLAIKFYLYWQVVWFDLAVHFLGGFLVSVFFIWLFSYIDILEKKFSLQFILLIAFFSTLPVSILWEVFEVSYKIAVFYENYILDTSYDIAFSLLGGISGGFYSFFKLKKGQ